MILATIAFIGVLLLCFAVLAMSLFEDDNKRCIFHPSSMASSLDAVIPRDKMLSVAARSALRDAFGGIPADVDYSLGKLNATVLAALMLLHSSNRSASNNLLSSPLSSSWIRSGYSSSPITSVDEFSNFTFLELVTNHSSKAESTTDEKAVDFLRLMDRVIRVFDANTEDYGGGEDLFDCVERGVATGSNRTNQTRRTKTERFYDALLDKIKSYDTPDVANQASYVLDALNPGEPLLGLPCGKQAQCRPYFTCRPVGASSLSLPGNNSGVLLHQFQTQPTVLSNFTAPVGSPSGSNGWAAIDWATPLAIPGGTGRQQLTRYSTIPTSWLRLFRGITKEGAMRDLEESLRVNGYAAAVFHAIVLLVGRYFVLATFLAILLAEFNSQYSKSVLLAARDNEMMFGASANLGRSEGVSAPTATADAQAIDHKELIANDCEEEEYERLQKPPNDTSCFAKVRRGIYLFVDSAVRPMNYFLCVLNIIALGIFFEGMPEAMIWPLYLICMGTMVLVPLELLLRLLSSGPLVAPRNLYNWIDVAVCGNLAYEFFMGYTTGVSAARGLRLFEALYRGYKKHRIEAEKNKRGLAAAAALFTEQGHQKKLNRRFADRDDGTANEFQNIIAKQPSALSRVGVTFNSLIPAMVQIFQVLFFVTLVHFSYALLGHWLFGEFSLEQAFGDGTGGIATRADFSTLWNSCYSVFMVLCNEASAILFPVYDAAPTQRTTTVLVYFFSLIIFDIFVASVLFSSTIYRHFDRVVAADWNSEIMMDRAKMDAMLDESFPPRLFLPHLSTSPVVAVAKAAAPPSSVAAVAQAKKAGKNLLAKVRNAKEAAKNKGTANQQPEGKLVRRNTTTSSSVPAPLTRKSTLTKRSDSEEPSSSAATAVALTRKNTLPTTKKELTRKDTMTKGEKEGSEHKKGGALDGKVASKAPSSGTKGQNDGDAANAQQGAVAVDVTSGDDEPSTTKRKPKKSLVDPEEEKRKCSVWNFLPRRPMLKFYSDLIVEEKKQRPPAVLQGTSLRCFGPKSGFRGMMARVCFSGLFFTLTQFVSILNVIFLILDASKPLYAEFFAPSLIALTFQVAAVFFAVMFFFELVVRLVTFGGFSPQAPPMKKGGTLPRGKVERSDIVYPGFFTNWMNVLSSFIAISAFVTIFVPEFRVFRSLRTLTFVLRFSGVRVAAMSFAASAPYLLRVFFMGMFVWVLLALTGMHLFSFQTGYCTNSSLLTRAECTAPHHQEYASPRYPFLIASLGGNISTRFNGTYDDVSPVDSGSSTSSAVTGSTSSSSSAATPVWGNATANPSDWVMLDEATVQYLQVQTVLSLAPALVRSIKKQTCQLVFERDLYPPEPSSSEFEVDSLSQEEAYDDEAAALNKGAQSLAFEAMRDHFFALSNSTRQWLYRAPPLIFNHLGYSLLSIFVASSGDKTHDFVYGLIDTTEAYHAQVKGNSPLAGAFGLLVLAIGSYFILASFMAVPFTYFLRFRKILDGRLLLPHESKIFLLAAEVLEPSLYLVDQPPLTSSFRKAIHRIVHWRFKPADGGSICGEADAECDVETLAKQIVEQQQLRKVAEEEKEAARKKEAMMSPQQKQKATLQALLKRKKSALTSDPALASRMKDEASSPSKQLLIPQRGRATDPLLAKKARSTKMPVPPTTTKTPAKADNKSEKEKPSCDGDKDKKPESLNTDQKAQNELLEEIVLDLSEDEDFEIISKNKKFLQLPPPEGVLSITSSSVDTKDMYELAQQEGDEEELDESDNAGIYMVLTELSVFDWFVACVVVTDFIAVIMATDPRYVATAELVAIVTNSVFIAEALLRIIAGGLVYYFRQANNRMNFVIALLSLFWLLLFSQEVRNALGPDNAALIKVFLSKISLLRIAKLLQILNRFPKFQKMFAMIAHGISGLVSIIILILVALFIFTLLSVDLFEHIAYNGVITPTQNFQSFPSALLILFQLISLENWSDFMKACSVQEPDCSEAAGTCGRPYIAIPFFVAWIFLSGLIMLQLGVAVLLDVFQMLDLFAKHSKDTFTMAKIVRHRWVAILHRHGEGCRPDRRHLTATEIALFFRSLPQEYLSRLIAASTRRESDDGSASDGALGPTKEADSSPSSGGQVLKLNNFVDGPKTRSLYRSSSEPPLAEETEQNGDNPPTPVALTNLQLLKLAEAYYVPAVRGEKYCNSSDANSQSNQRHRLFFPYESVLFAILREWFGVGAPSMAISGGPAFQRIIRYHGGYSKGTGEGGLRFSPSSLRVSVFTWVHAYAVHLIEIAWIRYQVRLKIRPPTVTVLTDPPTGKQLWLEKKRQGIECPPPGYREKPTVAIDMPTSEPGDIEMAPLPAPGTDDGKGESDDQQLQPLSPAEGNNSMAPPPPSPPGAIAVSDNEKGAEDKAKTSLARRASNVSFGSNPTMEVSIVVPNYSFASSGVLSPTSVTSDPPTASFEVPPDTGNTENTSFTRPPPPPPQEASQGGTPGLQKSVSSLVLPTPAAVESSSEGGGGKNAQQSQPERRTSLVVKQNTDTRKNDLSATAAATGNSQETANKKAKNAAGRWLDMHRRQKASTKPEEGGTKGRSSKPCATSNDRV